MATFPSMNRVMADDRAPDTGLSTVMAPDGSMFGQSFYDDEYFVFSPTFINHTESEANTLLSFYATNKLLAFDFDWVPGNGLTTITYECQFMSPGVKVLPIPGTGKFMCWAWFRGKEKP